ncbi:DUF3794 domain-containing protein [Clostridium sp. SYSU_GA19001]|uniref:DUF3794 domain-containing protein n=1 Tax=Clostridium caldaquaticum TaxID=2940653 RepID=UPI0020775309|nr:DUF3794 domain-containing protein [Clostridium caldaquaticum]MCM8709597.1 DUF3794 domain-containing protein [Clostridium caldaquaticum]
MGSIVKGLIDYSGIAIKSDFPINPRSFKQFTVQEDLEIPSAKPDIEQIVRVIAQVVITNTRVIVTPVSTSYEGQILTGRKLIVEGELVQKIEYVADEPAQSVHAAHFTVPFSTYIVLDSSYTDGDIVTVVPYIEDIYVQQIDKRKLFKNVALFLHAVIS